MADTVRKATSLLLLSFFLLPAALAATISSGKGPWCVLWPDTSMKALQANIEYACGSRIADCSAIQVGGPCYSTDSIKQASYAMNAYYYAAGHDDDHHCYFNGTGRVVFQDPSYGNCVYPS